MPERQPVVLVLTDLVDPAADRVVAELDARHGRGSAELSLLSRYIDTSVMDEIEAERKKDFPREIDPGIDD